MNLPVTRDVYVNIFCYAMPSKSFTLVNDISDGSITDLDGNRYKDNIYKMCRYGILNGKDERGTF